MLGSEISTFHAWMPERSKGVDSSSTSHYDCVGSNPTSGIFVPAYFILFGVTWMLGQVVLSSAAPLAQCIARQTSNLEAAGWSPAWGTFWVPHDRQ